MNRLVDTCVLSELSRTSGSPRVRAYIEATPPDELYISVLTVGELRRGIERLPEGRRRDALEEWFIRLRSTIAQRIIPIDEAIAARWGVMVAQCESQGRPLPVIDGLLAATALEWNMAIVTRNTADFAATGVSVIDPWQESQ